MALLGIATGVLGSTPGAAEQTAQKANDPPVLRYDCIAASAKTGPITDICILFAARLGAAFPDHTLQHTPEADVVLVVDTATDTSFGARIERRGHPPGDTLGTMQRGASLGDAARAALIDRLLANSPR